MKYVISKTGGLHQILKLNDDRIYEPYMQIHQFFYNNKDKFDIEILEMFIDCLNKTNSQ